MDFKKVLIFSPYNGVTPATFIEHHNVYQASYLTALPHSGSEN
ncbi:25045_t:CDS:1, partial [Racocetra persica]